MRNKNNATSELSNFDWDKYENGWKGGNHVVHNDKVLCSQTSDKVYCQELYAQEAYEMYTSGNFVPKDLVKGQIVTVMNPVFMCDTSVRVDILGGMSAVIDLSKEKKFLNANGYANAKEFIASKNRLFDGGVPAYVAEGGSNPKISLSMGISMKIRAEFMDQITSSSIVYDAKILEANNGGFFVDLKGERAFMPGSLAAANKIIDFNAMIGKTVPVMVEDYITDIDSFIVSFKKYIKHELPNMMRNLDVTKAYTGTVTGSKKFGIFIEFDEYFTGLLHVSNMSDVTRSRHESIRPGETIQVYIQEIKENRIILTEESYEQRIAKEKEFFAELNGESFTATCKWVNKRGLFLDYKGHKCILPREFIKEHGISTKNITMGIDTIDVQFTGELIDGVPEVTLQLVWDTNK